MLRGAGTHLWNRGEADAAFHRLVIWLAAAIVSVGCAAPRDGASPGLSPTRRLTAPFRGWRKYRDARRASLRCDQVASPEIRHQGPCFRSRPDEITGGASHRTGRELAPRVPKPTVFGRGPRPLHRATCDRPHESHAHDRFRGGGRSEPAIAHRPRAASTSTGGRSLGERLSEKEFGL